MRQTKAGKHRLFFVLFCIFVLRDAIAVETITTDLTEMPEATVEKTFDDFPDNDSRVAFVSPDGSTLISALTKRGAKGVETEIFQWNIADKKIVQSATIAGGGIAEASFSVNGRVLCVAFIAGNVVAWDLKSGKSMQLRPHEKLLSRLAVSSDGKNIVTEAILEANAKETSLSVQQKHPTRAIPKPEPRSQCSSLAYSADGNWLAGGFSTGTVIVWDAKTLEKKWEQKAHSKAFQTVFSADSQTLVSAEINTKIVFWDAQTGSEQAVIKPKGFPMQFTCMSPTGKFLATIGKERDTGKQTVVLWNTESRKGVLRYTLKEEQQSPAQNMNCNIVFMPDESGLVVFGKKPFVIGLVAP